MEYQSKRIDNVIYGPQIEIEVDRRGLGRTIFDTMRKHKNKIMQINASNDETESYEYVNEKCVRIAIEMRNRGIDPHDVVMVCSGNNLDTAVVVYSTLYLNAVAVTLDPTLPFIDSIHLIKTVSPKFIFVMENSLEQMEQALSQTDLDPEIIVIGNHDNYPTLSDFLCPQAGEEAFKPDYVDDMNSTAMIFFTSGTTGLPRQVHMTHDGILSASIPSSIDSTDTSTVIFYTSFLCSAGFVVAMITLFTGGKRIVVEKFAPETFCKYVQEYQVTYCYLPAAYAVAFNEENTKQYNTEYLREMRVGGGTMPADKMKTLRKCFPGTNIYKLYGVKETFTWISTFSKFSDTLARIKLTSVGVPFINTKIKIADIETGRRLGPNEEGEICVTGTHIAKNFMYANNDTRIDDEGYIRTGDIGVYDEDNCLYFRYRMNDSFKCKDWYVVPHAVETQLYDHPAIKEACVIGIPVELDDHYPLALVTLKDDYNVTARELLEYFDDRLSYKHQLRAGLKIVNKFPKTYTGKIPRQVVRQIVLTGNMKQLK